MKKMPTLLALKYDEVGRHCGVDERDSGGEISGGFGGCLL